MTYNKKAVMPTIKEEISAWGKRAFNCYVGIADGNKNENGSAFYTQSPLDIIEENLYLVVMGINPGSTGPFAEQIVNQNWKGIGFPSVEGFLKGNIFWEDTKKMYYWQRIRTIFEKGGMVYLLNDDKKFVCTNITPFGTRKEKDLNRNVVEKTAHLSVELLDILKPKVVLCLGVMTFGELCRLASATGRVSVFGNVLSIARHNGMVVMGIHHPSAAYSNEQMCLVGQCLRLIFDRHETITAEQIREDAVVAEAYKNYLLRKQSPTNSKLWIDMEKVAEQLKETGFTRYEGGVNDKTCRFWLCEEKGFALTVTNTQHGYIGVRHDGRKGSYLEGLDEDERRIKELLLARNGYKEGAVWLATKAFSEFGADEEGVVKAIVEECKRIKELIEER